ncbi:hypothetical protein Tco_0862390 [Tanacetum coccineum]
MAYCGGKRSIVHMVDIETFSIHDLNLMVRDLGYTLKEIMFYNFKRLFLDKVPHEETQGRDKIRRFSELPLQKNRFSETPTQESRFTQLPTQQSLFLALDRELEEINDVSDNYQVNDMAVDDTMRCEVNETMVEDSGMREESYDDVASTDMMDDDNYDANYVYEGSGVGKIVNLNLKMMCLASQYKGPLTRSRACGDGQKDADKDKGKGIIDEKNKECPWVLYCTKVSDKESCIYLTTHNLGTTIKCQVEYREDHNAPARVFKRTYVCLCALKQGSKAIGREFLGLDGDLISGSFPRKVLTVVGINANNGVGATLTRISFMWNSWKPLSPLQLAVEEVMPDSLNEASIYSFPIPRRLYIEKGMMLILAPKSAKALLKSNLLIEQGRIKLPGSFSFGVGFPWFHGINALRMLAFWEKELGERTVLYSRLLLVLGRVVLNLRQRLSHGRWTIPLDKGLFEEIPGIDSSWGESVHLSFCSSGKSKGKNSKHDCVFRDSGNIE